MGKMQAAFISRYGRKEKLSLGSFEVPSVGDNDVLVEIHAASLNPVDFKIRDGKLKFIKKYSFPLIVGHDLAGVVSAVGSNVSRFRVGDKVFGRPRDGRTGTLAEFIAVDESELAVMPENLSFVEAASIPLVGLTSWQALVDVAGIKPGSRVFIQAGSGGVGTFAIQLAKHFGCFVVTTTSERNFQLVRDLGADEVIDYRTQKFDEVVRNVDVVLDALGGESLYRSFRPVRLGGWVISISGDPDEQTAKDLNLGSVKRLVLKWVGRKANDLARQRGAHYRFIFMKPRADQLAEIAKLIEQGKIKPVIDREFSLQESQQAMEYLESGRARGKVVVRIRN